nr:MAG TPA: hypothetical protein [Caudoviricetes sp.]
MVNSLKIFALNMIIIYICHTIRPVKLQAT